MFTLLRNEHDRIAAVFQQLTDVRMASGNSVYFCEHGLSKEELDALRLELRATLALHPLSDFRWMNAYLPLVVCAAETGYEYEGNGTDFWPDLERATGYRFDFDDRHRLSEWFAKAAELYGGAVPPDSDWAKAFCHIVWPITHAVAAKDIRRPFCDALRRFHGSLDNDDASIVSRLRWISPQMGSRRYRTWLANQALVAGLVRDLLRGTSLDEANLLSRRFRGRLIDDLRREPEFSVALRVARRRQSASGRPSQGEKESAEQPAAIYGTFLLQRHASGEFELLGELPEMPKPIRQALHRQHRSRRWRPRPWGFSGATVLPRGALTSRRGTFPVSFSLIQRAADGRRFFVDIDELGLDHEAVTWLRSVHFPSLHRVACLPIEQTDEVSYAVTGRTPHQGPVWVIHSSAEDVPTEDARYIGELSGGVIHEVAAADPQVRDWLGWPEAKPTTIEDGESVQFVAPTPVTFSGTEVPVFQLGDVVGVRVPAGDEYRTTLTNSVGSLEEQIGGGLVLVEPTEPGEYILRIWKNESECQLLPLEFSDDGELEAELPWEVRLHREGVSEDGELTRRDLFNRRLLLDVAGSRSIEDLQIRLTINPGPSEVLLFADALPLRIPSTHDVWAKLVNQLPDAVLSSHCDLELSISVGDISKDAWRLEADSPRVWWEVSAGKLRAVGDAGEYCVESRTATTAELVAEAMSLSEPVVSVARDNEGALLNFDARVDVAPNSMWPIRLQKPDRLLRELDDRGSGLGLRSVVTRYLQLASASSGSKIAELHRVGLADQLRNWVLEICCGDHWSYHQTEQETIESLLPIDAWWSEQLKHRVTVSANSEAEQEHPQTLPANFAAHFSSLLPDRWWDGAPPEISDDDAARLDHVYQTLLDDNGIFVDSLALQRSLREANWRLNGSHLADLIVPATGGDELLSWSLTDVTVPELAIELRAWIRRHLRAGRGRQSWSQEELGDWLNLLLYPEQLRNRPWEALLAKLLVDRCVARAGALVAWRVGQIGRIESAMSCQGEV